VARRAFAARRLDRAFPADLPPAVDACGENGELHTFVSAGPMLHRAIGVRVLGPVGRDGFRFWPT
jgi:diphthamide synthase (EF-2-diphthine--ammonia ligase)